MADDDLIDDDEIDDETGQQRQPDIKDLRRAARDGSAARKEADAAKRELAFVKAGVDTDSPGGKLLLKAYDGELTVDAIKAEAGAIGALKVDASTPPASETEIPAEERNATTERQTLASGASADTGIVPPDETPAEAARKAQASAMASGVSRDDSVAAAAAAIRAKAESGDARALYTGPTGTD